MAGDECRRKLAVAPKVGGRSSPVPCTLSVVADHRLAAPAGYWLLTSGIFAVNAMVAAGNGMGLMAIFALVAAVAALWTAWVGLPNSSLSQ